ncbi:carotenoid oxygenase family protein [Algimonas porphyrae]|uniref:Dioxygenase n=1 Tax=Algimonas porphyrae TaxID=1128113 RepID=A0ABQ5UYE4_9PROT|nr:carotenoid oxygenase family protein [Algimonas porphyrae]GLQ19454.1 carotenoid cleavage dioxygenase [Algimonas porphyrae]
MPDLDIVADHEPPSAPNTLNARNPYLNGIYAPVHRELTVRNLDVIGEIPHDLSGVFVRNGPNPKEMPTGMHHWFDGDGMLHAIHIEDGRATYRNRYIRTSQMNRRDGGIFEPNPGTYRDTANTDIVCHNGELMALWYVSGQPVRLDPVTLETFRSENFGGKLPGNVSAHSKVDPNTGEFIWFDYALYEPHYTYGVVNGAGEMTHITRIDLPGPRLPHDMAITEHHSILMDLPVVFTEAGRKHKVWHIHQDETLPTRFGVIPRHGDGQSIRWFSFPPCYIYHVVNAWEEGDEIVLMACRMVDNGLSLDPELGPYAAMSNVLSLRAHLWEWRMNLKTGATKERQVDDSMAEFPVVNLGITGRQSRYSYHGAIADLPLQAFDGLLKYDLKRGTHERHDFGPNRYGCEPAFAPRLDGSGEDDGYVISFVSDAVEGRSEALILDARNFSDEPLARIQLPQRVPQGFHATWVTPEEMRP